MLKVHVGAETGNWKVSKSFQKRGRKIVIYKAQEAEWCQAFSQYWKLGNNRAMPSDF